MSNYHYGTGDCIQDLSIKLAESDIDPDVFDEAWRALGVVVAVLYRKRLWDRPSVVPEDEPAPPPKPEPVTVPPVARRGEPIATANGTHLCPDCGFESVTAKATRLHFRRMHGDLMHPLRVAEATATKLTARQAWERAHGPNLPFEEGRSA